MPVKIENLTNRPVLLRLRSGRSLHLAPRKTSEEISDVEVINNAKVSKLQAHRIISLHQPEQSGHTTGRPTSAQPNAQTD